MSWTRDWPTEPGWWWVLKPSGERIAVEAFTIDVFDGDRDIYFMVGDVMLSAAESRVCRFHPMPQPPAPPEEP